MPAASQNVRQLCNSITGIRTSELTTFQMLFPLAPYSELGFVKFSIHICCASSLHWCIVQGIQICLRVSILSFVAQTDIVFCYRT